MILTALGRAGTAQKVRQLRTAQGKPSSMDRSVQNPLEEPVICAHHWGTNYFQTQVYGTPQVNEVWSLSFTESAASTQRHSQQDRNVTCRKLQNTAEISHYPGIVLSSPAGHLFGQSQLSICLLLFHSSATNTRIFCLMRLE